MAFHRIDYRKFIDPSRAATIFVAFEKSRQFDISQLPVRPIIEFRRVCRSHCQVQ